ncbi:MAG: signal peptidase I [Planctomycetota bacterium]
MAKKTDTKKKTPPKDERTPEQRRADAIRTTAGRETVEAFVVAFVLALLFRAFVAEAFVIPTGSMAPTLMGAHKDICCSQCGHAFQVGASKERRGRYQDHTVVGGICPNCRFPNSLDLVNDGNHGTFNGDRILVSKSAYVLSDPERWDVIVFKFPGNPKQNYIKRLVGLPNETISIQYGDVYVRPLGAAEAKDEILRKPADKLIAMRHHVYDTDQQSPLLIAANYPARLQPWREGATSPPTDSWEIKRSEGGVIANVAGGQEQTDWVRYFHRFPTDLEWGVAVNGGKLDNVDPYQCRLITDFYAYDCYITVPSREVYVDKPINAGLPQFGRKRRQGTRYPPFEPDYESGGPLSQFRGGQYGERGNANEGLHWVGDLMVETDIQIGKDCTELTLELVESGLQYQCRVDTKTGEAKLVIVDGESTQSFTGSNGKSPTAQTPLTAGGSFEIRFSNCDDQLLLWVDDELITFDAETTFNTHNFRTAADNHPHYRDGLHPLDGAPVGIGVRGTASIDGFRLYRDKYYCATDDSMNGISDYRSPRDRQRVSYAIGTPSAWEQNVPWESRRKVSFDMGEDQFFPMGDNSPESLDARCWAGAKRRFMPLPERFEERAYQYADASYVPRDLLVGKALLVFWPHHWRSPVPHPNISRIRLIR